MVTRAKLKTSEATPGPWGTRRRYSNEGFSLFREERGTGWLREHRLDAAYDGTFREADARLMAAAPELLEALEWAERCMHNLPSTYEDDLPMIRAAIAKARGEA